MDAQTAAPPSAAHLQLDSPMRPQVIKFCYKKRHTGHSRNGKDDSSQDPNSQPPSSPLSRKSLSTSAIPTYHAGGFYEIDHERLPPRTPIHLKSIRVVKVSEYTSLDITVSFPSLLALRSFFSSFLAPSTGPELDERFVMSSNHAARILRRRVAEQELQGEMHQDSFWLVNPCLYDFSASSHPATLPDALSSPEAPPAQPKAPAPSSCLLDTLKCDGAGWGVRRRIRYIGRHRDASKEASIGGYETESSVKEVQRPAQQEDKRSSVNGKRKQRESERSNDKPSNERRAKKKKTYKSPKKQKKRHVESKDGDPRRGKDRWSAERYTAAETSLLEIMRSSGDRLGAPVMRQALREQARMRIGDTGLLDHLLKHMAGRVPDGSTERFRRRHNADGAMEYWLEPADRAEVRREAGVSDPYWVPPPGWKPGDDVSPAAGDLLMKRQVEELTEELNGVKRHMEELSSNMVQLGKEAKSEAERTHSSWKDKYQKVVKANEKIEKQILSLKDNYENVVQKNSKLKKEVWSLKDYVSPAAGDLLMKRQVEELTEELNDVKRHMEQLSSNMVQLGKEAKSEAERAHSSWKDKYQKVVKANEKIEKQILCLKDNYENVVQKNSKLKKDLWSQKDDVSPAAGDLLMKRQVEELTEELNDVKRHMEQLRSNMVQLGKEAKSEAERAHNSWKDKYQKVVKANEKIEKQILSLKGKNETWTKQTEDRQVPVCSLKISNRIPRPLLLFVIMFTMFTMVGSVPATCNSSNLADNISHFCNPPARTMECCEPIVSAVDFGGGIECLCLLSHNSSLTERGLSFKALLEAYIDCGGLHPEAFHHASLDNCPALQPAKLSSPPPPQQDTFQPPPTSSASPRTGSYWDIWNDRLAIWHEALGLPSPKVIIEGVTVAVLLLIVKRFQAYIRPFGRRGCRLVAGLVVRTLHRFGMLSDSERAINELELAAFGSGD